MTDQTASSPPSRLVVSGHGSASAEPDSATLHVDARVVRSSPTEALDAVTAVAANVHALLVRHGVAEHAIVTSPGHIDRERQWESGSERIVGWFASYAIRAEFDDTDRVFPTLFALSELADTTIGAPSWGIAPDHPARARARSAAVADARATAEQLAAAAGLELGPIVELCEGTPMGGPVMVGRASMLSQGAAPPPHGLESVDAHVTITFAATGTSHR